MKKTLIILIACFAINALSAKDKTSTEVKLKVKGKKNYKISTEAQRIADYLDTSRAGCAATSGCGLHDDFCSLSCSSIIMNCHRIPFDTFQILTEGISGFATFSASKVLAVLNDPCQNSWIRCYVHHGLFNTFFRISSQPDHINDGLDFETYYSKPLLQGIYDKGITSIVLYKGILTSTGDYILPIKVNYISGEADVEYYDISNDLP